MTRYIILLHIRPEGSLGVFDPSMITVTAVNETAALVTAAAIAEERGWESERVSIVRRESVE